MTATQTPGRGESVSVVDSQQPRPGTTETPDERADRLLRIGLDVAVRIRDEPPDDVTTVLDPLDRLELRDLTVLFAAALDINVPVRVWYAWANAKPRQPPPCGTAAAIRRHWARGEEIDDVCRRAERIRDRERARYRRQRAREQAA